MKKKYLEPELMVDCFAGANDIICESGLSATSEDIFTVGNENTLTGDLEGLTGLGQ